MLIAGLTGGLACGKSFVAGAFKFLGCHVVEADDVGREVMTPGTAISDAVIAVFGLPADRPIDRAALGRRVFAAPSELAKLTAIVHPAVRARSRELFSEIEGKDRHAIVIYVAAILVETGAARDFAKLIAVRCTPEEQLARAVERGLSREEALDRLRRQLPSEKKLPWADYVIDNSGPKEETLRQTKMVYDQLKELAL